MIKKETKYTLSEGQVKQALISYINKNSNDNISHRDIKLKFYNGSVEQECLYSSISVEVK